MRSCKQLVKSSLKPFYQGLKRPAQSVLRWLRDYFTQPHLSHSESYFQHLAQRLEVIIAQLGIQSNQTQTLIGQLQAQSEQLQAIQAIQANQIAQVSQLETQVVSQALETRRYVEAGAHQSLSGFQQQIQQTQWTQQTVQTGMRVLQDVVQETDRLVLALLKTPPGAGVEMTTPTIRSVALDEHRLLVSHPTAVSIYLDTRDLFWIPQILFGDHPQAVLEALRQLVKPGERVVEIGSGTGYFTLAIAQCVGPEGTVQALEPDLAARDLLHTNLVVHGLMPPVEIVDDAEQLRFSLADEDRFPSLVCLHSSTEASAWLPTLTSLLEANTAVRLLVAVDPRPTARNHLPNWLKRLALVGLRFWWIQPDGYLMPMEPEQIAATPPGEWGHFVAARTID